MSAQHTPGPWTFRKNYGQTLDLLAAGGATVILNNARLMNQEPNARLIAAAPDLLDALQLCEGNIDSLLASCHPKVFGEWLTVVRAAIAKATGKQA
jgi:hypothetical protein